MAEPIKNIPNRIRTIAAGFGAPILLAAAWNAFIENTATMPSSYPLTEFFTNGIDVIFVLLFILVAAVLGWFLKSTRDIATGMMLPLPISAVIEILIDSTSHNLIPFEIVLYWLPAFGLAWAGAFLGSIAKRKMVKM